MLSIQIPDTDLYDYKEERFYTIKGMELFLEHSLVSLSKWESIHHKPLLENDELTNDDLIDYIKCMTINKKVDPLIYNCISQEQFEEIKRYMDNPMTATWFSKVAEEGRGSGQKITSELIYSWMIDLGIWKDCEKWHLRRLITLIRVRSEELKPKKKNKAEAISHYRNLKSMRRAKRKH